MNFRKAIFWLHLVAGVVAGIIILVMSATGVMLSFERQITPWADGYQIAPPTPDAKRLPMESLLGSVQEAQSNAVPSSIVLRSHPGAPVAFGFGREKTVFANPYTGELLGEGAKSTRAFFHWAVALHRWLGAEGEGRATGKAITGAANLVFLFIVVSGVYLWWPRKWSWSSLKAITLFKGGLRGKARDWNWHNAIGFWSALPLVLIVASAVVISYPWASNLVYRVTGNEPPPPKSSGRPVAKETGAASGEKKSEKAAVELNFSHMETMWSQAEAHTPVWRIITLRLPTSADAPFAFTVDEGNGARPDLRTQLSFAANNGDLVSTETYASQNSGRKLRLWIRWIHTGEAGGIIGQTIAALASLGAVFLVYTGLMLTWRRFLGRKNPTVETPQTGVASAEVSK